MKHWYIFPLVLTALAFIGIGILAVIGLNGFLTDAVRQGWLMPIILLGGAIILIIVAVVIGIVHSIGQD